MINPDEAADPGQGEGLNESYPPPLRAVMLFSSLVGSWVAVVAVGILVAHLI